MHEYDYQNENYARLMKLWQRAFYECDCSQAIFAHVAHADSGSALHLTRAWKALAKLYLYERNPSAEAVLPSEVAAVLELFNQKDLADIQQKDRERWRLDLERVVAFDRGIPESEPLDESRIFGCGVNQHLEWLSAVLQRCRKRIRREQHMTWWCRFRSRPRRPLVFLAAFLVLFFWAWKLALDWRDLVGENQIFYNGLLIKSTNQDWGTLHLDKSVENKGLSVGKQLYPSGLGTHANSAITVGLHPHTTLSGGCGVDGECTGLGSIVCKVTAGREVLFRSGILHGGDPAVFFSVPARNSGELTLEVEDAGDGIVCDHADWVDLSQSSHEPADYLGSSNLILKKSVNGSGTLHINKSAEDKPILINKKAYPNGIGTAPRSVITLGFAGAHVLLTGGCGVDDECPDQAAIVCKIMKGDEVLFKSEVLHSHNSVSSFWVPVTGVEEVNLVVEDAGNAQGCNHADWVDLKSW